MIRVPDQDLIHQGTARLRTGSQVQQPFLPPDLLQRSGRRFTHRSRHIRPTEGAEAVLGSGTYVGRTRIWRSLEGAKHQQGDKISLVQHVVVRPGGETTTVMQVPAR